MPTGWNMQIFNAKMAALPFAGGSPTWWLVAGGAALFVLVAGGATWRRKKLSPFAR